MVDRVSPGYASTLNQEQEHSDEKLHLLIDTTRY